MFKIKEAAMGSVTRRGSNVKHRFLAVGSFDWVVFGLVLGWVVSAYSDRI